MHYLDSDGVVRSYGANGTVIDYLQFSNAQLMAWSIQLAPSDKQHIAKVKQVFAGVSGHDVTSSDQLYDPPDGVRATWGPMGSGRKDDKGEAPTLEQATQIKAAQSENKQYEVKGDLQGRKVNPCHQNKCITTAYYITIQCYYCIGGVIGFYRGQDRWGKCK
jgi:hypothetical protein